MAYVLGFDLSPKKIEVIKSIYQYRGITADLLLVVLNPEKYQLNSIKKLDSTNRPAGLINLYTLLRDLQKQGIVTSMILEANRKKIYFLTKVGLELVHQIYDVIPGYKGSGYDGDFGEFPYELYRPPKGTIYHHLLLVETMIQINEIANFFGEEIELKYVDNRYSSRRYKLNEKEKESIFRPDAELMINGKKFYIEIDRGSEYLEDLRSKFEGYERYFLYLSQTNEPLSDGIIFVMDDKQKDYGFKRRWLTLTQAFTEKVREAFLAQVNLTSTMVSDLYRVILKEVNRQHAANDLMSKVKYYIDGSVTTGFFSVGESHGLEWDKSIFSYTHYQDHSVLFLYEFFDGYDTRGIMRAYRFINWFKRKKNFMKEFEKVNKIVPVFYNSNSMPIPISFDGFVSEYDRKAVKIITEFSYVLNIKEEPTWYSWNGERIRLNNALKNPNIGFKV